MRISFVIPTFNRANVIGRAVQSILSQPYKDVEIIVVDDGSTDNLHQIMKPFLDFENISLVVFSENKGQNISRNTGIREASGDIVTILDSDDEDGGNNLQVIVDLFIEHPELLGVFTPIMYRSTKKVLPVVCDEVVFGAKGFVDGTYRGEHQAFLRKSMLPNEVFEEGLGVRRSCTLITWLKLGVNHTFMIKDYVTRLYNDVGEDRLGDANALANDAGELVRCNELMLERSGHLIEKYSRTYYFEILLNKAFYELIAYGRRRSYKTLFSIPFGEAPKKRWFIVVCCLLLGSRIADKLRRL